MIPKIIHEIWFQGFDQLPEKYNVNVQSVIDKNPDWQLMKWDDTSLRKTIATIGSDYLKKYDGFKIMHQKIDFGRYAVLYVYGGVSVDIDALALKSFNETPQLETSDFIISKDDRGKKVNNAIIFISTANPLMKELLTDITDNCIKLETDFSCIVNSTGPGAFNDFVDKHKDQITILDNSYFEPCSGANQYCEIKSNAIIDHQHAQTWFNPTYKKASKQYYEAKHFFNDNKSFLVPALIFLAVMIGLYFILRGSFPAK